MLVKELSDSLETFVLTWLVSVLGIVLLLSVEQLLLIFFPSWLFTTGFIRQVPWLSYLTVILLFVVIIIVSALSRLYMVLFTPGN